MAALSPTHAGGVVFHDGRVLIVRPSDETDVWVFPKGHVENDETAGEAAVREVAEEAGVIAQIERKVGEVAFRAKGEDVRAVFFRMRFTRCVDRGEHRDIRWVEADEAERLLSHPESVRILRLATSTASPSSSDHR